MNKKRLFASTRNNGSAQSGLARVSAAFVVLIGIVLLVMSGCAGDVTVPVPVPTQPKPEDPLNPPDSYSPAPGLTVAVEISAGTVMQRSDVTLSATVTNVGPGRSREYALLVFYRSEDAVISPDLLGGDVVHSIGPSAEVAISDAMHTEFGLDPVLYADFIKRSLAADQNVSEAVDERASQNAQEGVAGIILDPIIDSKRVERLAVNQVSEAQTITISSTADVSRSYYGACVILVGFHCASAELVVTLAPAPDLVPASPAAPIFNELTYLANQTVTVNGKVRNAGGGDSTDGVVRLFREAGDTDVQIGDPIALGTIVAGATADFSTTFVTAGTIKGVHQQEYYFTIDMVSNEVNSSNNTSGTGLIVVSEGNVIDGDNDNLIDIYNLDMLSNIRYNLAGTSYKTSDTSTGTGNACGEMGATDCIGYELMRDLDFTHYASYENNNGKLEWLPNNYNPAKATNAGWEPIGSSEFFLGRSTGGSGYYPNKGTKIAPDKAFSGVFEGNGHRINNLYARSEYDSGLFNVVTGTVRNLTVVNGNVYAGDSNNKVGIVAGTVFKGMVINCAVRGGSASGGRGNDAVGGIVGLMVQSTIAASYSSANVYTIGYEQDGGSYLQLGFHGVGVAGGLIGRSQGSTIIASYAAGTVHGGVGQWDHLGGLVGGVLPSLERPTVYPAVIASYATGNAYGGPGMREDVGGLAGSASVTGFTASYATGNVNSGNFPDLFSPLVANDSRFGISVFNSYGFGSAVGYSFIVSPPTGNPLRHGTPKPNSVIYAGDLTASNAGANWNSASSRTAGAWAFDANYGAPALKYADYDGGGGVDYCAHFLAGACSGNRLLPNQPVLDQGGSSQSAYVIDTEFYPGVGLTIPAKLTIGDTDYFQITVKQAGLLNIESDSGINTQATLYASNGTALEYDDNDGAGNNFKISRAVSRGVFYIRAYGYSNQAGSYTLNVTLNNENKNSGPAVSLTACPTIDGHAPDASSTNISANVVYCTYSTHPVAVACPAFQGWEVDAQPYGIGSTVFGTICTWRK